MKFRSRSSSTKKDFINFFYRDVTVFHQVLLMALFFRLRIITKNVETHPPPMRDVIIEQPHTFF